MNDGTRLKLKELIRLRAAARGLELGARRRTLSAQAGGYLSAYRGRGLEFDEVRVYQASDDARTIDWRVTARRGNLHTKLFREERERPVLLLVDLNAGMFFGSRRQFKSVLAGRIAALLGWAAIRSGDRVGGIVVGPQGHRQYRPAPREGGFMPLLDAMVRLQPNAPAAVVPGRLDRHLARMAQLARPGSLVVILSDFGELGYGAEKHVTALARQNDVIAAFLFDPLEASPPPSNLYRVGVDARRLTLDTGNRLVAQRWLSQFQGRREHVRSMFMRQSCSLHGGSHHGSASARPPARIESQVGSRMMGDPLAALRPLHAPPPISWWPPAPGWWFLLLIAVVVAGVALWWRKRTAPRRAALRELKALQLSTDSPGRKAEVLNRLLKRYVRFCWPRSEAASLVGESWLVFLDSHGGNGQFLHGPGKALLSLPYGGKPGSVDELVQLTRRWIKRNGPGKKN